MTSIEKEDSLFGKKNNKRPLRKSNIDYKDPSFTSTRQTWMIPTLYSDTSKFATGSVLYQIQNGQPRLIAYESNRMPEAAKNYSITELEMPGLAMNIAIFCTSGRKLILAIMHIMRSKAEPATTRIKRLIELLSPYSFNLYYIKGNNMVLSDFLSRQRQMIVILTKLFLYLLP